MPLSHSQTVILHSLGKKIIVTNAYRKTGQKMPKGEKDLAIKCMEDYLKRNPDTEEADK